MLQDVAKCYNFTRRALFTSRNLWRPCKGFVESFHAAGRQLGAPKAFGEFRLHQLGGNGKRLKENQVRRVVAIGGLLRRFVFIDPD